jgi:hypothetical protein
MGVIAAQLGHADPRMTEKDYAHLAPWVGMMTGSDKFDRFSNHCLNFERSFLLNLTVKA